jgi:hypothetical protein
MICRSRHVAFALLPSRLLYCFLLGHGSGTDVLTAVILDKSDSLGCPA